MSRFFTSEHEWIEVDGDVATVGITEYAAGQLGDIVFVEVPVEGRTLGNLTTLSFDFLRNSSSNVAGHLAPAFRLSYAQQNAQTGAIESGYLIWENVYNGGSTSSAVATDVFKSNDILGGNFWMRAFGPGRTIEDFDVTLEQWASGYTTGSSHELSANTLITGIEVGVGSGWGGTFSGAVDNVAVGFGLVTYRGRESMPNESADLITANFEPDAIASVPESSTWAMMIGGFGLVGGALRRRQQATVRFA